MTRVNKLILNYKKRGLKAKLASEILKLLGVHIPITVTFGSEFQLIHGAVGTVVLGNTRFGNNVRIYSNVTIGRADILTDSNHERIIVEDDVTICTGARILVKSNPGILTVGKGSIIAANAVLLNSTGENEIWAGVPAKCIGVRE